MPANSGAIAGTVAHKHSAPSGDGGELTETITNFSGGNLGEVLTATATAIPVWATVGGGGSNTYAAKIRSTDASKTNDTTLADDATLIVALAANKSYFFQCTMFINANASGHFKYAFSLPAGAGGSYQADTPNGIGIWAATTAPLSTSTTVSTPSSGVDGAIMVYGTISTVGTADNFALQWAQDVSEPVATYLLKGSSLVMWES